MSLLGFPWKWCNTIIPKAILMSLTLHFPDSSWVMFRILIPFPAAVSILKTLKALIELSVVIQAGVLPESTALSHHPSFLPSFAHLWLLFHSSLSLPGNSSRSFLLNFQGIFKGSAEAYMHTMGCYCHSPKIHYLIALWLIARACHTSNFMCGWVAEAFLE